ncbi:hypothetical protein ACTXT7_000679 [Hymenolepis weldensis]
MRVFKLVQPEDILTCTRELNATKEELAQRNEEVVELKAERNNTRMERAQIKIH